MTQDIIKLITLILGVSVAGERLVTIIKSFAPFLAAPPGSAAIGTVTNTDIAKKIALMIIAFICCMITTEFCQNWTFKPFDFDSIKSISPWLIALMATGGSAFWTNILGYFSALKDATNLKALQAKTHIAADEHALGASPDKRSRVKALRAVTFTAAFSGGAGTLAIKIAQTGDSFQFTDNGSKTLQLPEGQIDFTISGAAAPGPDGGVVLTITGARASNSPITFGPGIIRPQEQAILV